MVTTGLIVRLEARAGKEDAVAEFMRSAVPLVEGEPRPSPWFAVRLGPSSYAIVDVSPTTAAARRTWRGPSRPALMANADELLSESPDIQPVDVLAEKLP